MPLILVAFLIPFFWSFAPPGAGVHLIIWSTESAPLVAPFSWTLSLCALLLYLHFSWGLAATSVRITAVANRDSDKEIQQLTQSRTTLIDAFTGERRRIERELHDGAQQYLTALQLNIAAVELAATQSPQLHAEILEPLNQAKANAHEALVALRATVRGIYPQVLADKGIVEALQELVAHSGVAGELNASTKQAALLPPTEALLLYHCGAEGITNAVKHGHATTVLLTLVDVPEGIQLSIHDNGVAEIITNTAGTGIAGLQERAQALGGAVTLQKSSALTGAQLVMIIPLKPDSPGVTPSKSSLLTIPTC